MPRFGRRLCLFVNVIDSGGKYRLTSPSNRFVDGAWRRQSAILDVIIYITTGLWYNRAEKRGDFSVRFSSRLTIALHMLACIETFKGERKVTSDFLAGSVNVNPVVIRRLLSQLKAAGIVDVARGTGGTELKKPLEQITMLDVCNAVECLERGELFRFHANPNPRCPVGRNIHAVLDGKLLRVRRAMEDEMRRVTMAELIAETQRLIRDQA